MRLNAQRWKSHPERGVSLFIVLFMLLLLSAIAASLVLMTNTETAVNSNYRSELVSDLAAKAGIEESRDRMNALTTSGQLPVAFPPAAGSVLYILNEGSATGTVQPWTTGNTFMDDELCHDFAGIQTTQVASDIRCTTPPTSAMLVSGTLSTPVTSTYPWAGTSAALPYKWIRVTLKASNSVQGYPVNGTTATQVCWNGSREVLLSGAATCQTMVPSNNPVYMITSLSASSTGSTRRMVQAEVALNPAQPFPYGLFATGTTCPAITFSGGGNSAPATDSYNSASGAYGGTNQSDTGGDIGANGGISMSGNSQIGGAIGVPTLLKTPTPPATSCGYTTGDLSLTGSAGPYNPNSYPGNLATTIPPYSFPTPADPTPLPVSNGPVPSNPCTAPATGTCAVPGTYGKISLSGQQTLTLAPGVYNVYSLSLSGQSSINVNPAGAVILNFPAASSSPLDLSGQGITSSNNIPANFQINYGGTGTITLSGNSASYATLDAPNASVTVSGNGDFYGAVLGKTITYSGNGKFHFDRNSVPGPPVNGIYTLISFRVISY